MRRINQSISNAKRDFKQLRNDLTDVERDEYHNNMYHLRERRREIRKEITQLDNEYFLRRFLDSEGALNMPLYRFMAKTRRKPKASITLKDADGIAITTEDGIRQELSRFWNNIFLERFWMRNEAPIGDATLFQVNNRLGLTFAAGSVTSRIMFSEVKTAISQLKNNSSSGSTDIVPEWLKALNDFNILELVDLFNIWWDEEFYPEEGLDSLITLLHKKGVFNRIENYRTLSLGCNLCKIYNRVICNRLESFVEKANILGEAQNGFRKNRRSVDNLLIIKTITELSQISGNPGRVYTAFLDLTKAYDRVNRTFLFAKMEAWGIPEKLIHIIRTMYTNPTGRIRWEGIETEPLGMNIGLKQGCVLSPILFAIYLAELSIILNRRGVGANLHNVKVPLLFYADDIALLANSASEFRSILLLVGEFFDRNHIEISPAKSSVMVYGRAQDDTAIWSMGEYHVTPTDTAPINLHESDQCKYLGITLCKKTRHVLGA